MISTDFDPHAGSYSDAIKYGIPAEWGTQVEEMTNIIETCVRCCKKYTERNNVGRWECWQHVGRFDNQAWSCCSSRRKTARGCVRADHTPKHPYKCNSNIRLPQILISMFAVPEVALVPRNMEGYLVDIVLTINPNGKRTESILGEPRSLDSNTLTTQFDVNNTSNVRSVELYGDFRCVYRMDPKEEIFVH